MRKHGRSAYNYGCRCAVCREANRIYAARYRAERLQRGVDRLIKGYWVKRAQPKAGHS